MKYAAGGRKHREGERVFVNRARANRRPRRRRKAAKQNKEFPSIARILQKKGKRGVGDS